MKFILIPVKDLSLANERLSSVLSQSKRTELAYVMLEDVFAAVKESKLADKKVVVTLDKKAIKMALANNFEVIQEEDQEGESSSVDGALQVCKMMGAKSVLVIPGDAPLITGGDLDSVFEKETEKNCVVLAPSSDELGTNAILRKPPDVISSFFGHDSFRKHKEEADKRGVPYEVVNNFNISIDIDEPEDIEKFTLYGTHTKTYKKLVKLGLIKESMDKTG
ncbi:MAG: 2-phospho-L-lactate guanylyltransferase [Candidatus Dadabacteria bacterium]|nr:2-phospho-L-lactate guanylyltransferase [Candidatus Dadabacteria bacterium]NIQ14556.1 2-phospho-L-lactate guanylyltransferase [Candidatus Dadabacteria bacterium]